MLYALPINRSVDLKDHPLERLLPGAQTSLFVSDVVRRDGRLEMSDFERFGLICDDWLDAAKEDTTTRRIASFSASNLLVATGRFSADAAAHRAYTSPGRLKGFGPLLVTAA